MSYSCGYFPSRVNVYFITEMKYMTIVKYPASSFLEALASQDLALSLTHSVSQSVTVVFENSSSKVCQSFKILPDPPRSYKILQDPSRSYKILQDTPRYSKILNDHSRSFMIIRDPS